MTFLSLFISSAAAPLAVYTDNCAPQQQKASETVHEQQTWTWTVKYSHHGF